jgi:hypothetical protein
MPICTGLSSTPDQSRMSFAPSKPALSVSKWSLKTSDQSRGVLVPTYGPVKRK